ncbi:unnamed protein product [Amoebophrya sp. A120]|nr:unnamed protein product [Amoebophrya sp. A120]|eukprot:GSA120T00018549001.1
MAPGYVSRYLSDFLSTLLDTIAKPGAVQKYYSDGNADTDHEGELITEADVQRAQSYLRTLKHLQCTESVPKYEIDKFFGRYKGPKAQEFSEAYKFLHQEEAHIPANSKLGTYGTENPSTTEGKTGESEGIPKPGAEGVIGPDPERNAKLLAERKSRVADAFFALFQSGVGAAKIFVDDTNKKNFGDLVLFPKDAKVVDGAQRARLDVSVGWDWNRGSEHYAGSSAVRYWHVAAGPEKDAKVEYWRPPESPTEFPTPCRCWKDDALSCKKKLRTYLEGHVAFLKRRLQAQQA